MNFKRRLQLVVLMGAFVCTAGPALATVETFTITIKDHMFTPAELTVPANKKIKLVVVNEDPTPEEFESHDLNREKIVTGNGTISLFIGPLKPGEYKYFGEFNEDTAQGVIKVSELIEGGQE